MGSLLCPVAIVLLASIGLVGCAPASQSGERQSAGQQQAGAQQARKTLIVAALEPIEGFGPELATGRATGTAKLYNQVHTAPLVANQTEPWLAERLPSLENGTLVIRPDGGMVTTWKLRPNAKWHDGAPVTSDDLAFTFTVRARPDIPWRQGDAVPRMERVETPDPTTAVIHWRTGYFEALALGLNNFWPLPKHLLEASFQQGDMEAFVQQPYFNVEYIHAGPFRLVDFALGESAVFERFDDYFLGKPKVDRIIVKAVKDENALLANVLAGEVDITNEGALPRDIIAQSVEGWKRTGEVVVAQRDGKWRFLNTQFNPATARPPEVSRDVRLRRGLYIAIDGDGLRSAILTAFTNTEPHTFMLRGDPRAPIVGEPFARYRYDRDAGLRELAESGWRRGPAGRMLNQAGQQVQMTVRAGADETRELSIIAQNWRDIGIDVTEEVIPRSRARDAEYRVSFPAFEFTAQGNGPSIFSKFATDDWATAENRFRGSNEGNYSNREFDRLLGDLRRTLDQRQQGEIMKRMGEVLATDLPALPIYTDVGVVTMRKGVRALSDDYPKLVEALALARNAHLWDKE